MMTEKITLIGAGSLGSFQALLISKIAHAIGCEIEVFDHDKVESHNTDNQLYRLSDAGSLKADSLKKIVYLLTEKNIKTEPVKINQSDILRLRGIVIVMVDSMAARREIFEACKNDASVSYYIEARTGGNTAYVYAFNPRQQGSISQYAQMLYSDKRVLNPACATIETVPALWAVAAAVAKILILIKKDDSFRDKFLEVVVNFEDLPLVKTDKKEII
ncbi:MAG: hypothetical protein UW79_C0005G0013 [Candidatus Yanofskybacteria bacterium GW2011_GWA2_44_9]|uniref:THIF-type NAD/FAD binding fold domain-containing protein n=2 Tax=Candidatus Yanofskyibacteriota TaxID=1752733 RepID=A0A0G1KG16_9BACT|nr:MAG: hypothetical protein UW79_C0005G0013 [Candidatus Yanofskybacteria bacterium GW2011_GWA2_44_9]